MWLSSLAEYGLVYGLIVATDSICLLPSSHQPIPSLVAILATTSPHPSIHLAHDIQRVDIPSATQLLCFALESNILSLRRVFPI
jgi:hypothetical protein